MHLTILKLWWKVIFWPPLKRQNFRDASGLNCYPHLISCHTRSVRVSCLLSRIIVGPIGCRPYSCFSPPSRITPAISSHNPRNSSVTKPIIDKTSIFSWFERQIQHIIHGWKGDSTRFHLEMTKTNTNTHTNDGGESKAWWNEEDGNRRRVYFKS